jgi:membrane fusion protein (multidrug efflux system)
MGSRRVFWSAIGAIAVVAVISWVLLNYFSSFAVSSPGTPTGAARAQQTGGIAVEAAPVVVGTVIEDLRAVGTLAANETVVISTEISGRISRIAFREGEAVKAGDVLVELDDNILKAELDKVRSDMALARANRERAVTLATQGSGTQRARDETEAAYQSQQANIALAEARLQKAVLTAPLSGIVGLRNVSVGAYVTPGQRIVELSEIDTLKVDFRVPELNAAQIRVGQKVLITADAVPGASFEGNIYAIDPIVDINGRAIRLRARVPNRDGRLSPGFFARIRIVLEQRQNAVLVPESAIIPSDQKVLVYRVVNGRAVQTEVVIGQRLPGQVEIRNGLSANDTVVSAGHQRLREGSTVQIVTPKGVASTPGAS